MKQQQLLKELKHKQIFGRYLGSVWTIEYQKRGLPHMHLLLFLHPEDRFLCAEKINQVISHQQEWFGVRTLLPLAASSGVLMASGRYCPPMSNSQRQL